ncbi:MAG: MoaD/ThiS family protein, partial [Planctomycetes bacterium]|nr:MoaD/ThiS family protein [Planctomycetota bacterium]
MPKVRIPTPLRTMTKGKDEVSASGGSVDEALQALCAEYAGVRERIYDEDGSVRRFVNVFVNNEDIRNLDGLATPVRAEDTISLVPAIAGGAVWGRGPLARPLLHKGRAGGRKGEGA